MVVLHLFKYILQMADNLKKFVNDQNSRDAFLKTYFENYAQDSNSKYDTNGQKQKVISSDEMESIFGEIIEELNLEGQMPTSDDVNQAKIEFFNENFINTSGKKVLEYDFENFSVAIKFYSAAFIRKNNI